MYESADDKQTTFNGYRQNYELTHSWSKRSVPPGYRGFLCLPWQIRKQRWTHRLENQILKPSIFREGLSPKQLPCQGLLGCRLWIFQKWKPVHHYLQNIKQQNAEDIYRWILYKRRKFTLEKAVFDWVSKPGCQNHKMLKLKLKLTDFIHLLTCDLMFRYFLDALWGLHMHHAVLTPGFETSEWNINAILQTFKMFHFSYLFLSFFL